MASDLISRKALLEDMKTELEKASEEGLTSDEAKVIMTAAIALKGFVHRQPTVDAVEVVHGEWNRINGDMHSSGYAVYCSVCHKPHFIHHKFSLGALNYDELFKEPDHCPNCGAKMDGGDKQ